MPRTVCDLFQLLTGHLAGFPGGTMVKNPPASAGDTGLKMGGKMPERRKWQPTPIFLPRKSHGQRSLAGYSPRGCKESDTTEGRSTAHKTPGSFLPSTRAASSQAHRGGLETVGKQGKIQGKPWKRPLGKFTF